MSNQEQEYLELLKKHLQGRLSPEEQLVLQAWIDKDPEKTALVQYIARSQGDRSFDELEGIYEQSRRRYLNTLPPDKSEEDSGRVQEGLASRLQRFKWIGIAAALLVFFLAGYYLYENEIPTASEFHPIADIAPGQSRATLILEDGSVIALDDSVEQKTRLSEQGISISETEGGELIYDVARSNPDGSPDEVHYHTIRTPAGGRYQVNLPDGSKVWLNSESSLRYPIPFASSERHVELSGEAYFEVAGRIRSDGKTRLPFVVFTGNQKVEVLGTHFNINAYKDEPGIKTTLLEGSVRVAYQTESGKAEESRVLRPGEQALCRHEKLQVQTVDTDPAVAWKNGIIAFNDEELHVVMRKIARWYDVDITFKDELPPLYFGGSVSSDKNLSEVLKVLELTGEIQCRVEASGDGQERRVVIMK